MNAGHTTKKKWHDNNINSVRQAFTSGLTTGLKEPSGKGKRLIVLDAGSEEGFVPNCSLVFTAKKGEGDYHEEMDGERFEKWFRNQQLPNIPQESVIVMDNASYHSVKEEKIPNTGTRKVDIDLSHKQTCKKQL